MKYKNKQECLANRMNHLQRLTKTTFIRSAASLLIALSFASPATAAEIKNLTVSGAPSFITGNLGLMSQDNPVQSLKNHLSSNAAYNFSGSEDFQIQRQWIDSLGKSHTHFSQTLNGLEVYGTSIIMHADINPNTLSQSNNSGNIYAINGVVAADSFPSLKATKFVRGQSKAAISSAEYIGTVNGKPELSYIYLPDTDETKLAWRVEVSWDYGDGDFGRDFIFFDAYTIEIVARHPQVHSTKNWKTYTLNGGSASSAPGTLLCSNTGSCGNNAAAQRAHDGASKVYDYYNTKFSRKSVNNNDLLLKSSVDMGENNAYWSGSQMMYGSASGGMNDFTSDFDVIGHELTHGVTQYTANLIYQNASGALNEAWSDILGMSAESYKLNKTTSTWLLGDGLYNNQPGKALRYMNNPTQDNYSRDYYPERIPFVSNPNNSNDQGGVHGNSGIANLAYVLLVDGGRHPRNKTTAQVSGIGMAKAEQIFYRALSTYMNQSTDFAGARTATAQAAQDLYGATAKTSVETAWCAVGVGACPSTGGGGSNQLTNGQTVSNLGASTGSEIVYTFDVPAGASGISIVMSGGSGDADMYVKFGSAPSDSSYDCRPYVGGNNETCNLTSSGGTYYIRLKAYATFSGVSLKGSYTSGGSGPTPISSTVNNISVGSKAWKYYTVAVGSGYSNLSVTTSGGTGDIDLYVRQGSKPTLSSYTCRKDGNSNNESCSINAPAAATWHIGIYGYVASSGITLNINAD